MSHHKYQARELLPWIEHELSAIYAAGRENPQEDQPPTLSRSRYLELYTTVYHYILDCGSDMLPLPLDNSSRDMQARDKRLYGSLEHQIQEHCREIHAQILASGEDRNEDGARELLEAYIIQYAKFKKLSNTIGRVMELLSRHWIGREVAEGRKDVYGMTELHNKCWRDIVLEVNGGEAGAVKGSMEVLFPGATLQELDGEVPEDDKELVARLNVSLASLNLVLKP